MFSSVAYDCHRYFTTDGWFVCVVAFGLDNILVLAFWFDASRERSAEKTGFLVKKRESHMAAPLQILLVLHANLKLHKNPIGMIGSEGSKLVSLNCAVIQFSILPMFFETV